MAVIRLMKGKLAGVERRAQEAEDGHLVVDHKHARQVGITFQIGHDMFPPVSGDGERYEHLQAPAVTVFRTDAPTVSLDDSFADGEAESRPPRTLRDRYAIELVGDLLKVLFWNSGTTVGNRQCQCVIVKPGSDLDGAVAR